MKISEKIHKMMYTLTLNIPILLQIIILALLTTIIIIILTLLILLQEDYTTLVLIEKLIIIQKLDKVSRKLLEKILMNLSMTLKKKIKELESFKLSKYLSPTLKTLLLWSKKTMNNFKTKNSLCLHLIKFEKITKYLK